LFTVQAGDLPLFGIDSAGVLWGVSDVEGWGSTGSTASQTQRPRQGGAWSGAKLPKARTVTISGGFTAPTPAAAQDALDRLASAVSRSEFPLSIAETTAPRWGLFYQTAEVIPVWVNSRQVDWSFQVASDDWRKFGVDLSAATTLPSTTGGLVIPAAGLRVPFTIDATTVTGQVALRNAGNEPGPVRLRVDGPCVGPVITHVSTGAQLVFSSSLVLGAGEWLDIDMEARTVLANGQASRAGWITSRGWSQFDPGLNTWSFTAASFTPAARLTVTATPSWK